MELNFIKMQSLFFDIRALTFVGLVLVVGGTVLFLPARVFSVLLLLVLLEILCLEWPRLAHKELWLWLLMPVYLILPIILMLILNESGNFNLLFLLLTTVPAFDVGAYLLGKSLGKHKLCPKISPNKTWEGVLGGYIGVLIVLLIARSLVAGTSEIWLTAIFALVIAVLATLGDLFESWLKRRVGLKDSGKLLPGHGGFLDRVDSFIFTTLFFYLFKGLILDLFF